MTEWVRVEPYRRKAALQRAGCVEQDGVEGQGSDGRRQLAAGGGQLAQAVAEHVQQRLAQRAADVAVSAAAELLRPPSVLEHVVALAPQL
eukprot:1604336-Pyramimonas_sp.AAC.1